MSDKFTAFDKFISCYSLELPDERYIGCVVEIEDNTMKNRLLKTDCEYVEKGNGKKKKGRLHCYFAWSFY